MPWGGRRSAHRRIRRHPGQRFRAAIPQSDGLVGWNIGCAGIRAGGLHRRVADEGDGVANQLGAAIGRGGVPFILDGRANRVNRSLQRRVRRAVNEMGDIVAASSEEK